jgi:hypothetical protein
MSMRLNSASISSASSIAVRSLTTWSFFSLSELIYRVKYALVATLDCIDKLQDLRRCLNNGHVVLEQWGIQRAVFCRS